MLLRKKWAWFVENYFGILLGISVGAVFYGYLYSKCLFSDLSSIISKITDICLIVFGFVLAFIGMIMQTRDKLIEIFKNDLIFNRILKFGFKVIILSGTISGMSFIYWLTMESSVNLPALLDKILVSLLITLLVWLINDIIRFIRIFFIVIDHTTGEK